MGYGSSHSKRLQDLIDQLTSQQLPPGQQQAALGPAQSFWPHSSNGSILDPVEILKILENYKLGLNEAELKELEQLKAQHEFDVKAAKLNVFKKLAPELRQYVINSFIWKDAVSEMSATSLEKSPRQIELENKDFGRTVKQQGFNGSFPSFKVDPSWGVGAVLPEGITIKDLQASHTEACLEEELFNGQSES